MADQEPVTAQMTAAGFAEITFQRVDAKVLVGDSIAASIGLQVALGLAGDVLREAGDLAQQHEGAIRAELTALLRPDFDSQLRDARLAWVNITFGIAAMGMESQ